MSEMVERVARAICASELGHFGVIAAEFVDANWHQFAPELSARYVRRAHAAIAAMREPTEAMIQEGYCEAGGTDADPENVWGFMIDEALK